ncbi:MAG: hypothetical protein LBM68_06640 [Bacteroidales bacterium]|nr:hypothetical protein [Bacteroidales bacterium]
MDEKPITEGEFKTIVYFTTKGEFIKEVKITDENKNESLSEIRYVFLDLLRSFYIALGWLLIPLAVASFTGLLTKGT